MKELETKLRSWQPRRPSATLKFKLAATSGSWLPRAARFTGWLAPVAACVLLAVTNLNFSNFSAGISSAPMTGMILSNETYATCWLELHAQGENSPPAQAAAHF